MKSLSFVVLASLFTVVGCAEATEDQAPETTVEVDTETKSFMDTFAAENGLTQATTVPICDSDVQTVTASKTAMYSVFNTTDPSCVPSKYTRGTGTPMQCRWDLIQSGAICYRPCKTGYTMVAGVCWQSSCPDGYRDDGAMCAKPAAYGRGAGYAIWDEDKCESRNPSLGCEKWGAMWYPKCREGYKAFGANVCSPVCPSGMTDTGVSCLKKTYTQNSSNTTPISYGPLPELDTPYFTAPLNTCPAGKERSGDLCYVPCLPGFKGKENLCTYSSN